MKVLVTLGPTQEPIDNVRFITNASSGKMGSAIASEAISRGHDVTIVSGPVSIKLPKGARVIGVRTAEEMIEAVLGELRGGYDVFISSAAIADYTPKRVHWGKIKSGREFALKLRPTRKLIRLVRRKFPKLFLVAFKAEYNVSPKELVRVAKSKLLSGNLDLIIANDIGVHEFGSDITGVCIISKNRAERISPRKKAAIASKIFDSIEEAMPS